MGNKARTLDEQIALLQSRGMEISDIEKAKEVLLDVGYYRLGFYWFPFEKSCPTHQRRNHEFNTGANFNDAVKLYYFDYALRNILQKYITRIEVNFRTYLVYTISNIFENYLDVVRCVRNTCAHGGLLYDIALYPLIRRGPANVTGNERKRLYGALKVVGYLLKQVSENRAADYEKEVEELINKYATTPAIKSVLHQSSGFPI
ncbi:MAG: Abi family protein [Bacteroides sp.]|nr:Abi family protein [Bacteroides sp.]